MGGVLPLMETWYRDDRVVASGYTPTTTVVHPIINVSIRYVKFIIWYTIGLTEA